MCPYWCDACVCSKKSFSSRFFHTNSTIFLAQKLLQLCVYNIVSDMDREKSDAGGWLLGFFLLAPWATFFTGRMVQPAGNAPEQIQDASLEETKNLKEAATTPAIATTSMPPPPPPPPPEVEHSHIDQTPSSIVAAPPQAAQVLVVTPTIIPPPLPSTPVTEKLLVRSTPPTPPPMLPLVDPKPPPASILTALTSSDHSEKSDDRVSTILEGSEEDEPEPVRNSLSSFFQSERAPSRNSNRESGKSFTSIDTTATPPMQAIPFQSSAVTSAASASAASPHVAVSTPKPEASVLSPVFSDDSVDMLVPPPPPPPPKVIPAGMTAHRDQSSGKEFYCTTATGETTWCLPGE